MKAGEERRLDNYIVKKRVQHFSKFSLRGADGESKKMRNVDIHFISLRPAYGNWKVEWREDSSLYQLIDRFIEEANDDRVSKTLLDIIFSNITSVCSSADVANQITFVDENGEEKEATDGLHLSVMKAVNDYFERASKYTYQTSEEENKRIEEEDKRLEKAANVMRAIEDKEKEAE